MSLGAVKQPRLEDVDNPGQPIAEFEYRLSNFGCGFRFFFFSASSTADVLERMADVH